ncbi:uncharacterized protein LOC110976636 [Acanthaster planci]|uniref:Uncharacterized protein LOC110976636 n=1 Tax=Acanthaster planci TaxID=133434 RepID=A0A8B7Y1D9_ACAPL|nr:uncharacterized protein LOC110976636 [Acanthaster planci]
MLYMQNKKLEEQLKKQNEELQEIRQNMRQGEVNSRGKRVAVPRECSQSVRDVYGKLYRDGIGGFNLAQIKTSRENEETISTLTREIRTLHGREKWSSAQIRKAAKTYFTSLRDKQRRMERGTYDQHALAAKRRSRKFRKLQRRQSALKTLQASQELKKEALEVLTIDYMSSEESMSEGEEDRSSGCKTRRLLKLPWERSKLASLKHKLDAHFAKTAPAVVSRLLPEFVISNVPSSRPPPSGAPSWAVRTPPN